MGRKKSTPPAETTERSPAPGNGSMTKADAVRAALAEGVEAPDEAIAFIKSRFGIEISKPHYSSYKSQLKAKAASQSRVNKVPRAPAASTPAVAKDDVGIVADLAAMKRLVEKLGVEQVKQMAGLFA
jgi:hypothetical protein